MNNFQNNIEQSVSFIKKQTTLLPKIAVVLGSGLGDFAENLSHKKIIDTHDIPNYPLSTVEGHKGKLIFGKQNSVSLLAFQGRVHFYESGNIEKTLYPIHVAHLLGIKTLLVTNAAGGINKNFSAGDLMLIADQINLTFQNPLFANTLLSAEKINIRATSHPFYDNSLCSIAEKIALQEKIKLQKGVYVGVTGPTYETASEIQMFKKMGADAVGMSTVNEVALANYYGMKVVGFSCITNLATGISPTKLSHEEVTETGNRVKKIFAKLISTFIQELSNKKK
ncbi:MAG: purine-nucleoside phosphorylase [Bacteroidota bacterium]